MIFDLLLTLLKKSRVARDLFFVGGILLVIVGIYEAGKLAERKATEIATKIENASLVNAQNDLQQKVNDQFGAMQKNINNQFATLQHSLETNNANITATRDNLSKLTDSRVLVTNISSDTSTSSNTSKTGTSKGEASGSYYARLSDSSLQFLKGEAYRADQCAVRLTGAQSLVSEYQKDIKEYQDAIQSIIAQSKINKKDTLVK